MLALLKKNKHTQGVVGLEFTPEGISLAVKNNHQASIFSDFCAVESVDDRAHALAALVSRYKLQGMATVLLMPADMYSILQLSSPVMQKSELRAAIKWRVRDLIAYPAEEAVVDVFELPQSGQRGKERMLYVVVSREADITNNIKLIRDVDLDLRALDINELALRNVIACLPNDNASGVAVLSLAQSQGLLVLIKESEMYLARRLEMGLNAFLSGGAAKQDMAIDQILLELQRSLDYFEGHFAQPLPNKLLVFPGGDYLQVLAERIHDGLRLDVELIDLNTIFGDKCELVHGAQSHCLLAVGAAMRNDPELFS